VPPTSNKFLTEDFGCQVATCSRSSGDVYVFDMKVCGITSSRNPQAPSRNTPTTIFSQRHGQTHGSVQDFTFVPAHSLMLAGTSKGAIVVWDTRSPMTNKGVLKQDAGGVCYLRVLRDGHSIVAGSTDSTVSPDLLQTQTPNPKSQTPNPETRKSKDRCLQPRSDACNPETTKCLQPRNDATPKRCLQPRNNKVQGPMLARSALRAHCLQVKVCDISNLKSHNPW
jgi:WD40 repeat protein